jgi:hypothetical protein
MSERVAVELEQHFERPNYTRSLLLSGLAVSGSRD